MLENASEQGVEARRPVGLPTARPRWGVVLAAGRSERLGPITQGGSKALIRLGGVSLVERAVRGLLACGLEQVVVVVGHHAGPVGAIVNRLAPARARAVLAEGWDAGNGASLAAAEPFVTDEDLFVLVTADHVFGEGVLEALLAARSPAVLVDEVPGSDAWSSGTRVRIVDGKAIAFGKRLDDPALDCGAFVLSRRIFAHQRRAADAGDASLAGAVTALATAEPLLAVPLPTGAWWHDVDTPEDLPMVRGMLRRSLTKSSDGPISRHLNRPISTRVSMAIAPMRLSPDLVSFVALLLGVVAAVLLGLGRGTAGAILVHLTSVVDGVDGEIARLQLRARPAGAFLDGLLDRVADAAILAGLGMWALTGSSDRVVLVLTVGATAGALLSMASKDRVVALGLPPGPERGLGFLLGGRDGRLLIVAVCAVVGQPVLALGAAAFTSFLSIGLRAVFVWSGVRHPRHAVRVPRITEYRFGRIVIDDRKFVQDVIVLPSRVVPEWWRVEGHSLCLEDLAGVLDELPRHLIVGTGHDAQMRPRPEALEALRERRIHVEVLPTGEAVRRYGELDPAVVAAALHLTC